MKLERVKAQRLVCCYWFSNDRKMVFLFAVLCCFVVRPCLATLEFSFDSLFLKCQSKVHEWNLSAVWAAATPWQRVRKPCYWMLLEVKQCWFFERLDRKVVMQSKVNAVFLMSSLFFCVAMFLWLQLVSCDRKWWKVWYLVLCNALPLDSLTVFFLKIKSKSNQWSLLQCAGLYCCCY